MPETKHCARCGAETPVAQLVLAAEGDICPSCEVEEKIGQAGFFSGVPTLAIVGIIVGIAAFFVSLYMGSIDMGPLTGGVVAAFCGALGLVSALRTPAGRGKAVPVSLVALLLGAYHLLVAFGVVNAADPAELFAEGVEAASTGDFDTAASRYQRACDAGELSACTNLGIMYLNGRGVAQDATVARELFERACDSVPVACMDIGIIYAEAMDVERDDERAESLWAQACSGGFEPACAGLGPAYMTGVNIRQDVDRAIQFYERDCERGDMMRCAQLSVFYLRGERLPQDIERGRHWSDRACEGGIADGCANLGWLHYNGLLTPQDDAQAVQYFQRACDGDSIDGCHGLGEAYLAGRGIPADPARALEFLQRACDSGVALACATVETATSDDVAIEPTTEPEPPTP